MDLLGRIFHGLRGLAGLADATESHLTPGHGWLLPAVADVRRERAELELRRAARAARARSVRA